MLNSGGDAFLELSNNGRSNMLLSSDPNSESYLIAKNFNRI